MNKKVILFGILFIFFLYIIFTSSIQMVELFDNSSHNIIVYAITLKTKDRLDNIERQKQKLHTDIILFDAVVGDKLDLDDLIKKGIVTDNYRNGDKQKKREIGCYLSHFNLYKKIKETNYDGYTLILEDDFVIKDNIDINTINNCIDKLKNRNEHFDLLFLGNLYNVHGENIVDNIYRDDKNTPLLCTHAYIVNNSSADKIINLTSHINTAIDHKLNELSKDDRLKMLAIYPTLVDQIEGNTIINNMNIELFKNYNKK